MAGKISVRQALEWLGFALGVATVAITIGLRLPGNIHTRVFGQGTSRLTLAMLLLLTAGAIVGLSSRRARGVAGGVLCLLCLPLWLLSVYVFMTLP